MLIKFAKKKKHFSDNFYNLFGFITKIMNLKATLSRRNNNNHILLYSTIRRYSQINLDKLYLFGKTNNFDV